MSLGYVAIAPQQAPSIPLGGEIGFNFRPAAVPGTDGLIDVQADIADNYPQSFTNGNAVTVDAGWVGIFGRGLPSAEEDQSGSFGDVRLIGYIRSGSGTLNWVGWRVDVVPGLYEIRFGSGRDQLHGLNFRIYDGIASTPADNTPEDWGIIERVNRNSTGFFDGANTFRDTSMHTTAAKTEAQWIADYDTTGVEVECSDQGGETGLLIVANFKPNSGVNMGFCHIRLSPSGPPPPPVGPSTQFILTEGGDNRVIEDPTDDPRVGEEHTPAS